MVRRRLALCTTQVWTGFGRRDGGKGPRADKEVVEQEHVMIANGARGRQWTDWILDHVPELNVEYIPPASQSLDRQQPERGGQK